MVLRRPDRRGAGRRCLLTGSGCSLVRIESGPLADGSGRDGHPSERRRAGPRRRTMARRLEAYCVHRCPGDNKPRVYLQEIPAGVPRAITPEARSSPARRGARRPFHPRSRRRHVDAVSGSGRRQSGCSGAQARRHPLQWSQDGRYVYTADNREGPSRPPLMSFGWSSRRAPGFSGKRCRRPTRWESKI